MGPNDRIRALQKEGQRPRMIVVARDLYPPYRVDVVELFSKFVTDVFDLVWLMRPSKPGPAHVAGAGRETFHVIGRPAGRLKNLRQVIALTQGHIAVLLRVVRGEFEIVQCRDILLMSPFYVLAARLARSSICYWMSYPMDEGYVAMGRERLSRQGTSRVGGWARIWFGRVAGAVLYRVTLPHCDAVFVQSEQMKRDVVLRGIDADRVHPVPMGVNTDLYDGPVSLPPVSVYGDRRVILYVGTLDLARRMEVAGRGVAMVLSAHPDTVFAIIGHANEIEREQLLGPARALGVADQVMFLPHMPLPDLFGHIRRATVCLATYPPEPSMLASATPTKLVEYLYLGARIVANRHPDQQAVLESAGTGVLTDFTPDGFAYGIEAALEQAAADGNGISDTRGPAWVRANRAYSVLAADVLTVYKKLI